MTEETFICVDVETAGPIPGEYAMLSIGACLVFDIVQTFYRELIPDRDGFQPEALAVSGLDALTNTCGLAVTSGVNCRSCSRMTLRRTVSLSLFK